MKIVIDTKKEHKICPSCGRIFENSKNNYNFCPYCDYEGKLLKIEFQ